MRDGVTLRADHYAPDTDRPLGTILVRGPYGRALPFSIIYARVYAARGYHVVFQSVRGTFGSGGEFVPMVHEADDAADTVAWLREQPWFTGTFGTIGLSYLGFTQWALLADPPPELAAAVVTVGPHDLHMSSWGTGAFALNDFLGWSDMVANQETSGLNRLAFQLRARRRLLEQHAGMGVRAASLRSRGAHQLQPASRRLRLLLAALPAGHLLDGRRRRWRGWTARRRRSRRRGPARRRCWPRGARSCRAGA
jgi:putative CocE/NonD family hydrolase